MKLDDRKKYTSYPQNYFRGFVIFNPKCKIDLAATCWHLLKFYQILLLASVTWNHILIFPW